MILQSENTLEPFEKEEVVPNPLFEPFEEEISNLLFCSNCETATEQDQSNSMCPSTQILPYGWLPSQIVR